MTDTKKDKRQLEAILKANLPEFKMMQDAPSYDDLVVQSVRVQAPIEMIMKKEAKLRYKTIDKDYNIYLTQNPACLTYQSLMGVKTLVRPPSILMISGRDAQKEVSPQSNGNHHQKFLE